MPFLLRWQRVACIYANKVYFIATNESDLHVKNEFDWPFENECGLHTDGAKNILIEGCVV